MQPLSQRLSALTRPASLVHDDGPRGLRCLACGHACVIAEGHAGICQVRRNEHGVLLVPWGYVVGVSPDPIEKKPLFHVQPGSVAYSFGMAGCNLHCDFCQNWFSSQALRDVHAAPHVAPVTPEQLVQAALDAEASSLVSTYNEPLITAEWAIDVFACARQAGLATGMVSNGLASPDVIGALAPCLDFVKIDCKSFDDSRYRHLGGRLEVVTSTIAEFHRRGVWVEVVTLVIPGFNDADNELSRLATHLAGLSRDLPWHVTAFHPDYHATDREATSPATLRRAVAIGRDAGLRYVYAGNLSTPDPDLQDTRCPECRTRLVERWSHHARVTGMTTDGRCAACGACIAGRWARGVSARR